MRSPSEVDYYPIQSSEDYLQELSDFLSNFLNIERCIYMINQLQPFKAIAGICR